MPRTRKTAKQPRAPVRAEPGDAFLDAFLADWHESDNGKTVIESLRKDKPADYVRIALSLFAKQPDQEVDPLHELTDAELAERIEGIAASLGLEIRPRAPARRAGAADQDGAAGS